jgi:hypothetical protein
LKELIPQVWDAIETWNTPPKIYNVGGAPSRLEWTTSGEPSLVAIQPQHVLWLLAEAARWDRPGPSKKRRRIPAVPPRHIIDEVRARPAGSWPPLKRFRSAPFFRPDGSLVVTPGYDQVSSSFYVPQAGLRIPPVAERPSDAEVSDAINFLSRDLLGDFCFRGQPDRANAIATMLTPFARPFYAGHTPAAAISKSVERAGGGLLVDTLLWPALGRRLPRTSLPEKAEEIRKTLFAFARDAKEAILFDNVNGSLDQSPLAAYLTSDKLVDRVLGVSSTATAVDLPWIYVTGIAITYSSEMTARVCLTELVPPMEHPEERAGFQHADLRRFVAAERGRAIWACCTLIRAVVVAGWPRPADPPILGDFQGWADALSSVMAFAGVRGFMSNRTRVRELDPVGDAWRVFVRRWYERFKTSEVTARRLWPLTGWARDGDPGDPDPLCDVPLALGLRDGSEKSMQTQFGIQIGKLANRVFDGMRVEYCGDDHNAKVYRLVAAAPADPDRDSLEGDDAGGISDAD